MKLPKDKKRKRVLAAVIVRLITGPAIFVSPWLASIVNFGFDWADGEIFKRAGWSHARYGLIDKILDYYWYIFVLIFIFVRDIPSSSIFLFLYYFRSFGQALFFVTKKKRFFFFFPNIFEILFFFYLISTAFPVLSPFMLFPKILYPIAVIIPLVLFREYVLHIKEANLSWFFTGKTTYWINEKK